MENIDFLAFSQDDFDSVEWLNSIFNNNNGQLSSSEKTLANNLAFKLQLMVEETNNSLKEIAQQMSSSIPKVLDEADILKKDAIKLSEEFMDIRTRLICLEQKHSDLMNFLFQMDRAKVRLEDFYQALQEANNWSLLSSDVEEVFESGNIEQISSKISNMQKCLEILSLSNSDKSELTDKQKLLENLKDRFEKLIEPILVEAFLKSSESIEFYSNLFKEFHRSDSLIRYYHFCLRDQLLKEWSAQVKVDTDSSVLNKLNFLYDRFNMIWKVQMNYCIKFIYPDNFVNCLTVLCDIFSDVIQSLDPPIESFIQQFLTQVNRMINKPKSLIELKQFTNNFIMNIEQNIIEHSDIQSANEYGKSNQSLNKFIRAIYQPFARFNDSFILFEKERLDDEFSEMLTKYEDLISNSFVMKLFSLIRESFKMYSQFVESYPLLIIEDVIEDFLLKYLNLIKKTLSQKYSCSSDYGRKKLNSNSMIMPNWTDIQNKLFQFQTLGEFVNEFIQFRKHIHSNFIKYQNTLQVDTSAISYFKRFDLFILNLDSNIELKERIDNFIQSPEILMNQVFDECVELIKLNSEDICNAMLNYVEIYLDSFDVSIEKNIKNCQTNKDSEEDSSQDIESLTFLPDEYITQIGQYLLMLPQHLEPFNMNENDSFQIALRHSIDVFNNYANLPNNTIAMTELLLDCLLRRTIQIFFGRILRISDILKANKISKLDTNIRKQIGVDLSYLARVCEDLGLVNDAEFLIYIQMFNNINSKEALQQLKDDNSNYSTLIGKLEEMITLE